MTSNLELKELKNFKWIAWKTRVSKYGRSYKIGVDKKICLGCGISQKKELYCYLMEAESRPAMVVFLDGRPKKFE